MCTCVWKWSISVPFIAKQQPGVISIAFILVSRLKTFKNISRIFFEYSSWKEETWKRLEHKTGDLKACIQKYAPFHVFFRCQALKGFNKRHRFNENAFIAFKPRMTLETLWRETRYEPITLINFDGIGRRNSYGKIDDRNFLNRFEIAYKI